MRGCRLKSIHQAHATNSQLNIVPMASFFTLDGGGTSRLLVVDSSSAGSLELRALRLTGGEAPGDGGAVLVSGDWQVVVTGSEALVGAEGETVTWEGSEGRVRVQGEIWRARADSALAAGSRVRVDGRDGLVLRVENIGSA